MKLPDFAIESNFNGWVAGADEAGRAPLAGPVTAAAVILDPHSIPAGINDSKKLSAAKREFLAIEIKQSAIAWRIYHCSVAEIEQLNILHASLFAMQRCIEGLAKTPVHALIDGNKLPKSLPCEATAVIKGDSKSLSIAAASILAKTARDQHMQMLAIQHPHYGWHRNAGYPTKQHLEAIEQWGITAHHRATFAPVRNYLQRKAA